MTYVIPRPLAIYGFRLIPHEPVEGLVTKRGMTILRSSVPRDALEIGVRNRYPVPFSNDFH